MEGTKKNLLIIYHSQRGNMEKMANIFADAAAEEENIEVVLKKAHDADIYDLLRCQAIAIGSPEYFGTMAGMVKDFFDRTFEAAENKTIGLPYLIFVCAGNDGRGAIQQIERLAAGYKWKQALEHIRITGSPGKKETARLKEAGRTLAAGLDFGIF